MDGARWWLKLTKLSCFWAKRVKLSCGLWKSWLKREVWAWEKFESHLCGETSTPPFGQDRKDISERWAQPHLSIHPICEMVRILVSIVLCQLGKALINTADQIVYKRYFNHMLKATPSICVIYKILNYIICSYFPQHQNITLHSLNILFKVI